MRTSILKARRLAGVGIALAASSLVGATMAPTTVAATGVLVSAGTASLPKFPCPSGCAGTAHFAALVGVDSAGRKVRGTADAAYTYFEPNGATCPAVGTAFGSIFPGSANVSANFTWARTGLIALVKLTSVSANGVSEPNGTVVSIFAPAPKAPLSQPGGCDNTKTASAEIAAVVSGGVL